MVVWFLGKIKNLHMDFEGEPKKFHLDIGSASPLMVATAPTYIYLGPLLIPLGNGLF